HSVFRLLPWLDPSPEDSVLAIIVARARATPFEPVHAFDFCAFNFCAFNFSAFNFSPARVGYSPRGQQPRSPAQRSRRPPPPPRSGRRLGRSAAARRPPRHIFSSLQESRCSCRCHSASGVEIVAPEV